jgi:hypothetical protein
MSVGVPFTCPLFVPMDIPLGQINYSIANYPHAITISIYICIQQPASQIQTQWTLLKRPLRVFASFEDHDPIRRKEKVKGIRIREIAVVGTRS